MWQKGVGLVAREYLLEFVVLHRYSSNLVNGQGGVERKGIEWIFGVVYVQKFRVMGGVVVCVSCGARVVLDGV